MSTTQTAVKSAAKRPVHEVRLGTVKAVIWENDTENGSRYNVQLRRIYHDGEKWHDTDSFGRDDLLQLGKVADMAHTWIFERSKEAA